MSEEVIALRLRGDGIVETSSGVALTGKSFEEMGKKADLASSALGRAAAAALQAATAGSQAGSVIADIALNSEAAATAVAGVGGVILTTAAAVGVMIAGYVVGQREARAYTRAIVMSGNAAGVTRDQLSEMARAVGATVGTQRQAADAIAQLVASGQVGRENLQQFTETAVRMESVVGQSVEDTVKVFADLGRQPLQSSKKLNESLNYLTLGTYDHIKALIEQGRQSEAASVAQQAYSDAVVPALAKIEGSLGLLERSLKAGGDAWSMFWDKALAVGRPETVEGRLARHRKVLADFAAQQSGAEFFGPTGPTKVVTQREASNAAASLAAEEADKLLGEQAAALQAEEALREKRAIAARDNVEGLLRQAKAGTALKHALDDAAQSFSALAAVGKPVPEEDQAAIRKRIHDTFQPAADHAASAYETLNAQIVRRIALARAEQSAGDSLTEADRFRAEILARIAEAEQKIGVAKANSLRVSAEVAAREIAIAELRHSAAKEQDDSRRASEARIAESAQVAERQLDQIKLSNTALVDETEVLGLNAAALYRRSQAKNEDQIKTLQDRLEVISGLPAYVNETAAIEKSIEALQRRRDLLATKEIRTVQVERDAAAKQRQADLDAENAQRTESIANSIEQGLLDGFRDGRTAGQVFLRELQAQFIRAALKVPVQIMAQGASDAMGGVLGFLKGLIGAGSAAGGAGGVLGNDIALGYHGGGVPGFGDAPAFTSSVPRFHGGRGPGELPAIIKDDEGVFTKGQMKAMAPVADLARAGGPQITVAPVINIDARTDKAEIFALVGRAMDASTTRLIDMMNRRQA